jgi:hypothetical protein
MPLQLWATFSVVDHLDLEALVADVLLYDKLIIPCSPPDHIRHHSSGTPAMRKPSYKRSRLAR